MVKSQTSERHLLQTICANGGQKTFLKTETSAAELEALRALRAEGRIRVHAEGPNTVTYSLLPQPRS